jgi:hypothetical protein
VKYWGFHLPCWAWLIVFQVLLWLPSYICWSCHDLPILYECVSAVGWYPFLGYNVASHCKEDGSLYSAHIWYSSLRGQAYRVNIHLTYGFVIFCQVISLWVTLTQHQFLFPLLWFLGMLPISEHGSSMSTAEDVTLRFSWKINSQFRFIWRLSYSCNCLIDILPNGCIICNVSV